MIDFSRHQFWCIFQKTLWKLGAFKINNNKVQYLKWPCYFVITLYNSMHKTLSISEVVCCSSKTSTAEHFTEIKTFRHVRRAVHFRWLLNGWVFSSYESFLIEVCRISLLWRVTFLGNTARKVISSLEAKLFSTYRTLEKHLGCWLEQICFIYLFILKMSKLKWYLQFQFGISWIVESIRWNSGYLLIVFVLMIFDGFCLQREEKIIFCSNFAWNFIAKISGNSLLLNWFFA